MEITDAQALAYGQREHVLNLWVGGRLQAEIIAAVPGLTTRAFRTIMDAARKRKDARAVSRALPKRSDAERERVIEAYALGMTPTDISHTSGVPVPTVHWILQQARGADDARAARRIVVDVEAPPIPPRDIDLPAVTRDVYTTEPTVFGAPRAVSVRAVTMITPKASDTLRAINLSIKQETNSPRVALTASLCGDPPPERSALGRECRPDEYASRGGEGRYRDRSFPTPVYGLDDHGVKTSNSRRVYGSRSKQISRSW